MTAALPSARWWTGRRVLVTGHTGFVGGWTCTWLSMMGARVSGYSLPPPTKPSYFERTGLAARLSESIVADVNDAPALRMAFTRCDPEVVIHLAAQPIVRDAFRDPAATFAPNVMGTVNVLDACRERPGVSRIVAYTTDKVYRNDQSGRAFREGDALGGNEPYSASKAAADWAITAYWDSFFRREGRGVATIRAGNIVGGGDWGRDRILPDAIRAFRARKALVVRNPGSTRPWQHVIDVVRATLVLAESEPAAGEAIAWNVGPDAGAVHPVGDVADAACRAWGAGAEWRHEPDAAIPESTALVLDSSRAAREIGWRCAWPLERAVEASVRWYREDLAGGDMLVLTERQIESHLSELAA